jgi:hypothetical protein
LGSKFAGGLQEAGWQVREVLLSELDVHHCLGCLGCWTRTPGRCAQEDDMAGIIAGYCDLDLVVLATPLYFLSLPGLVKDFVDRQLPLYLNQYLAAMGRPLHPGGASPEKVRFVLISLCGFPQRSQFDLLLATMRAIYGPAYADELLVPSATGIAADEGETTFAELYEVVRQAGREFGRDGLIHAGTRERCERLTAGDAGRPSRTPT